MGGNVRRAFVGVAATVGLLTPSVLVAPVFAVGAGGSIGSAAATATPTAAVDEDLATATAELGESPAADGDRIVTVSSEPDGTLTVDTVITASAEETVNVVADARTDTAVRAIAKDRRVHLADAFPTDTPIDDTTPDPDDPALRAAKHASAAAGGAPVAAEATGGCVDHEPTQWNGGIYMDWPYGQPATTVVAVLDTGVDATHPDLAGVVLPGARFTDGDGTISGDGRTDSYGHGTHVAGIISAARDGCGISGMSTAPILPVQVLDDEGSGWESDVLDGALWAADNGADILNLSLGSTEYSPTSLAVFDALADRNIAVVAAGGNTGQFGSPPTFPAAYPGVISVAATNLFGNTPALFSTIGGYMDTAAMGTGILSTLPGGEFGYASGTSMAAPAISGALAATIEHLHSPQQWCLTWQGDWCGTQPQATALDAAEYLLGAGKQLYTDGDVNPRTPQLGYGIPVAMKLLAGQSRNATHAEVSRDDRFYDTPMPIDDGWTGPAAEPHPVWSLKAAARSAALDVTWSPTPYSGTSAVATYSAVATPTDERGNSTRGAPASTCETGPEGASLTGDDVSCVLPAVNGVDYRVTVTVTNADGYTAVKTLPDQMIFTPEGRSDPVTLTSATVLPIGSRDPTYGAVTTDNLKVTFDMPEDLGGRGTPLVEVTATSTTGEQHTCQADWLAHRNTTHCIIDQMPAEPATYTITAVVDNRLGFGPSDTSAPLTVRAGSLYYLPPPPVTNPRIIKPNTVDVLTWDAPTPAPNTGHVEGYTVDINGNRLCTTTTASGDYARMCALNPAYTSWLRPGETYTAQIRAVGANFGDARPRPTSAAVGIAFTLSGESTPANPDPSTPGTPEESDTGYVPVSPARLLDTRAGYPTVDGGGPRGAVPAGGFIQVQVTGRGGIPSTGVGAVAVNLTATGVTANTYLTAYASDGPRPNTSNVNVPAGGTRANFAVLPVSSDGSISIYAAGGSSDVVVDVFGWQGTASGYVANDSPARLLDTRPDYPTVDGAGHVGMVTAGDPIKVKVTERGGVAADNVEAVAINVTATAATSNTYVTVAPAGQPRPATSNLNVNANVTTANFVLAPVNAEGEIELHLSNGSAHLIVDVFGWQTVDSPYTAVNPARLADTRPGTATVDGQGPRGAVGAGQVIKVKVTGRGGVPAQGVTAVAVNLTATGPTRSTFVTAYSGDQSRPETSNLNLPGGATAPNFGVIPVGDDGTISLYVSDGSTHLVVDVFGWFSGDTD